MNVHPLLWFTGILFIFCLLPVHAISQVQIIGTVSEADNTPIPSANVLILSPADSSLVKGAVTDRDGQFSIENVESGTYIISISMIGFKEHERSIVLDDRNDSQLNLERIILQESLEQLGEVVATARRPLYEQQVDRLVVNVQSRITTSGSSALEVLEKSPGVQLNRQSNNLSLNGKSGVIIMINDKVVRLPLEAVITMLNGMSSSNIEKIELITTPPARYDAEGNAGIINIRMKDYTDLGYTGTIGTDVGYNSAETLGGNFSFSSRKRKVALLLNYSISYNNSEEHMFSERFVTESGFTQNVRTENSRDPITAVQNLTAGIEYAITKDTDIELILTGYRRLWDTADFSENLNHSSPGQLQTMEQRIQEKNLWQNGILNLGIDHAFRSDRTLNLDLDYLYYNNSNPSDYQIDVLSGTIDPNSADIINVEKDTPLSFWVTKMDYRHGISEYVSLETGIKGTFSNFSNDVRVNERINGTFQMNNLFSNEADQNEFIGAAYVASNITPSESIQINAGIRYEYVDRNLSSPDEGSIVDLQTGRFFPSLFIQKGFQGPNSLNFSYSRRITRPTFWDLAPFVFFIDPNTFLSGNSNLKSAISDNFSLGFSRNQFLVTLSYSHSSDEIAPWQPVYNSDTDNQTYSTQNLDYLDTYALTSSFPVNLSRWLNIRLNATGTYQFYRSAHLEDNFSGEAAGFNANIVNTITLTDNLLFEVSGMYISKSVWGITRSSPMGTLDLGLQKSFSDGQGTLRLRANDILNTNILQARTNLESDGLSSVWRYNRDFRSVAISFSWNFGSSDFENVEVNSGSAEEQNRVGIN
ncbi:outer membrane beta-barrel protein [Rhodohalobacter mucosus]|uniref:Outer membrane protein beta-barrel domain-containing protein n=1 Tax=Rhodohalobacter mucosus TaxID=2079485 RepID=A0A316TU76_9BACT|nr:outer membrane beta-barrel family protein [Rhodohalobacter mucosus]PWN07201.1 hypothetical protein DDZ15_05220 [Rhodohalobacter mucosus]